MRKRNGLLPHFHTSKQALRHVIRAIFDNSINILINICHYMRVIILAVESIEIEYNVKEKEQKKNGFAKLMKKRE